MTDAQTMQPHITHNGTTRAALVAERLAVGRALELALDAHRALAPHGRDYQGGGDYQRDRDIWEARQTRLRFILSDLTAEALWIKRGD